MTKSNTRPLLSYCARSLKILTGACKITGNGLAAGCQLFYRKIYGYFFCSAEGRTSTSARFTDVIDALAEEEQELEDELKVSTYTAQCINAAENTKLMPSKREIKVKVEKLGIEKKFRIPW